MVRVTSSSLCILYCCIFCMFTNTNGERIMLQIEQGLLAGEVLQAAFSNTSYISFKGIPYAKPPVGDLRFKDPQPPVAWEGIRNATEHGATCPQVNLLLQTYIPGSEDCLFLNVYTRNVTNDTLRPVLVFIHGGIYKFGSGNTDNYAPDFFMNATDDIVVVTINYRLDSLGQLCLNNKDVPGNAGLKDQVYALRWIQNNIKQFGGNPDDVTLMGESAGAASVSLHLLSPMSKGLFHRAILQSGVALCDWSTTTFPELRALALARDNGFTNKNSSELLSFLQNISYDKLVNTSSTVLAYETTNSHPVKFVPFVPVVEQDFGQEIFMSETPLEALKAGHVYVDDVIIGYNGREGVTFVQFNELVLEKYSRYPEMFVPNKLLETANISTIMDASKKIVDYYFGDKEINSENMEIFVDYLSNFTFVYDIHRYTNMLVQNNVNVYFYKFDFISEWNYYANALGAAYNITGVGHLDELAYLFYATSLQQTFAENSQVPNEINLLTTLWTNFVKNGNPTPDSSLGFEWPKYTISEGLYLHAQNEVSIGAKPDDVHVQFARNLLESVGITFD